jgi:hypothetical protein
LSSREAAYRNHQPEAIPNTVRELASSDFVLLAMTITKFAAENYLKGV